MSRVKLKICGVQTPAEARQLVELGVDYIGLNFIPTSTRCISLETAESIVAAVQGSAMQTVALFQDQPLDMVNDHAARLSIDYVQLHGDESADYARQIESPVVKALAADPASLEDLLTFVDTFPAAYFVLDRKQQGQGPLIDMQLVRHMVTAAPAKIFLAGGLNADNLAPILNIVQPYGIDIAGGVRTDDKMDIDKVSRVLRLQA